MAITGALVPGLCGDGTVCARRPGVYQEDARSFAYAAGTEHLLNALAALGVREAACTVTGASFPQHVAADDVSAADGARANDAPVNR